jgi:hypothetical protein
MTVEGNILVVAVVRAIVGAVGWAVAGAVGWAVGRAVGQAIGQAWAGLSVCPPGWPSVCQSVGLSVGMSFAPSIRPSVTPSALPFSWGYTLFFYCPIQTESKQKLGESSISLSPIWLSGSALQKKSTQLCGHTNFVFRGSRSVTKINLHFHLLTVFHKQIELNKE